MDEDINTTEDNTTSEPEWYWDENTPGEGERPDFLPDKFKSVADAAKSYSELEKKLGSVPSDYDLSEADWIDQDSEKISGLKEIAKKHHMSQQAFKDMLDGVNSYLSDFDVDIEKEKAKLGDNIEERLGKLDNWAKSNLSEKAYNAIADSLDTADKIQALEEIREKMIGDTTNIPTGNESTSETMEDLQNELALNMAKYKTDSKYRRDIENRMEKVLSKKEV
jgi:hypothetical protein